MDEAFKSNISLLVNECLIRAIEVRMSKLPEAEQAKSVDEADREGYVLTRYFLRRAGQVRQDIGGHGETLTRIWSARSKSARR